MRCPNCSAPEDRVVDTRPSDGDQAIRRRRECLACQHRFTTYERLELELPLVVKKDGRREPFDRQKVLSGLKKACEKRPVSVAELEAKLDSIERVLQEQGEKEIPSAHVGEAVLGALRELDDVAYMRFASVYLSFNDLGELLQLVQSRMAAEGHGLATPEKREPDPTA
jgi:transcriptional repressor NrdR